MDPEDKEEILYHGTALDAAQKILAQKSFSIQETYFASSRALAELFAKRSCGKRRGAQTPVVVRVVLYESDLKEWKRNRLVRSIGFDEADRPELRGKLQLVFSGEAVRLLNGSMFVDMLKVEHVA